MQHPALAKWQKNMLTSTCFWTGSNFGNSWALRLRHMMWQPRHLCHSPMIEHKRHQKGHMFAVQLDSQMIPPLSMTGLDIG